MNKNRREICRFCSAIPSCTPFEHSCYALRLVYLVKERKDFNSGHFSAIYSPLLGDCTRANLTLTWYIYIHIFDLNWSLSGHRFLFTWWKIIDVKTKMTLRVGVPTLDSYWCDRPIQQIYYIFDNKRKHTQTL